MINDFLDNLAAKQYQKMHNEKQNTGSTPKEHEETDEYTVQEIEKHYEEYYFDSLSEGKEF